MAKIMKMLVGPLEEQLDLQAISPSHGDRRVLQCQLLLRKITVVLVSGSVEANAVQGRFDVFEGVEAG